MYHLAYGMQLLALLCALGAGGMAVLQLWQGRDDVLRLVERVNWLVSGALLLASALLLHALFWQDYRLEYVASYTDALLPVFYRLTAFWAGQPGSMLFWALAVAMSGSLFSLTRAYACLSAPTRLWYWSFFYSIMAFFCLVLTSWSNPFVIQTPAPADGNGLNPLLQNPGMIFHPPLLFLGYAGFTVPACLALAQALSRRGGEEGLWFRLTRPFLLLAWVFLTAGIVLGAWWAYMELGWGGYWAWDPVENASLIPWLVATAALHTLAVQDRRGKLGRVNVALMSLTTVSAFFATYLVRSGVVQSVHAFGDGGVGTPLLVFVLAGALLSFWGACSAPATGAPLAGPASREGLLSIVAWVFLSLAVIILVATMWPVFSLLWAQAPRGLDAGFYNGVCLPLGAALLALLLVCPWLDWGSDGVRDKGRLFAVLGAALAAALVIWILGYRNPVALLAAAAGIGIALGVCLRVTNPAARAGAAARAGLGAHLGMALVALGIAFSGPYTLEGEWLMSPGQTERVGPYVVQLRSVTDGRRPGHDYLAATLELSRDGKSLGTLTPERRIYEKFGSMQFSEVDVIPGLGNELYASLLGMDEDMRVLVKVSVEPLVNWIWIGGALMCLLPLLGLRRGARRHGAGKADADAA